MEVESAEGSATARADAPSSWRTFAFDHGFWVLSRTVLALALVAITWVVEIPVGDFLRLKDAVDHVRTEEDRLIERLAAGERTLNNAKVATQNFSHAVRLRLQSINHVEGRASTIRQAIERTREKEGAMWDAYVRDGAILGYGEEDIAVISGNIQEGLAELENPDEGTTLEAKVALVEHHLRQLEQKVNSERARIEQSVKR